MSYKRKIKIGIKLVHVDEYGNLNSAFKYAGCCSIPQVAYKVGEWVEHPKGHGPLCLFKNIEDAIFAWTSNSWSNDNIRAYSAEYVPSKTTAYFCMKGRKYYMNREFLRGTVFASRVKLLEEVKFING